MDIANVKNSGESVLTLKIRSGKKNVSAKPLRTDTTLAISPLQMSLI